MSTESTARVTTDRPARYGKQLASHLGRRGGGEWDEATDTGWVDFGTGRLTLTGESDTLVLTVTGDDLPRLEDVVGRHLVRFGAKHELTTQWQRTDGTAGTVQRNDAED